MAVFPQSRVATLGTARGATVTCHDAVGRFLSLDVG